MDWGVSGYGVLALLALCGGLGVLFRRIWTGVSRLRRIAQRAAVALVATMVSLLLAEVALGWLYVESDGGSQFTLAGQRWHRKHWKLNRSGYRDLARRPEDFAGKRVLLVLGDSFVAGYGIVNVQDRLSNLLQKRLGDGWIVVNLAKCGWDTSHELIALRTFEPQPDLVIWSYYLNDIEGVAYRHGLKPPELYTYPSEPWSSLISQSNVVNLLYWSTHDYFHGERFAAYKDYRQACFADAHIWSEQRREIEALIDHCAVGGIGLQAIVWPSLGNLAGSGEAVQRVADVLASRAVPFVNVLEHVRSREPRTLLVGRHDSHPNAALNHEVMEWVWPQLDGQPCIHGDAACSPPPGP